MHEELTYSCRECGKINLIEENCDCNLRNIFQIILYRLFEINWR